MRPPSAFLFLSRIDLSDFRAFEWQGRLSVRDPALAVDTSGDTWQSFDGPQGPQALLPPQNGVAANGLPIYNWNQAAAQLTRESSGWAGLGNPATVSFAFRISADTMPSGTSGFSQFTAQQIAVALEALALWSEVANVSFTRVQDGSGYSNNAAILFGNYSSGLDGASAFAYFPGSTAPSNVAGDVWVNFSLETNNSNLVTGAFGPHTIAHEIGHAIGLSHPGTYDATDGTDPTYPASATYWQDGRMFTVMSYFGSTALGGSLNAFAAGPQLHDIAAAQRLYGANMNTRTGDTTYGFNSNTGHASMTITADGQSPVFAIWDAGGNDTIDFSGFSTSTEIDLREEAFSSAGPGNGGVGIAIGNISIARGAVIENAIGGSAGDLLIGNGVANLMRGNAGADTLSGNGGNDTLEGGAGADSLDGGLGADTMRGGADDDSYVVDNASDLVIELLNEGTDSVSASISYSLTANVENLTFTGGSNLSGSGNALVNTVTGNSGANYIEGAGGNDVLIGLGGDDTLVGGLGADQMTGGLGGDVYYVDNNGDVVVELSGEGYDWIFASVSLNLAANVEGMVLLEAAGQINAGGSATDNFMQGNSFDNGLDGGAGTDTLYGLGGNDTLFGGGLDNLFGGTGNDNYFVDNPGTNITELAGEGYDWIFTSTSYTMLANVEGMVLDANAGAINAAGNAQDNYIQGNDADNGLDGGAGTDTLVGLGGNDTLFGGGLDNLIGGTGNDVYIVDNPGTNITELAGEGYDWIFTTTSYTMQAFVDGMVLQDAGGAINAGGNAQNNYIQGNSFSNGIDGGAGADTLVGFGGNDTFVFQAGQANGDVINDFVGNGAAVGDQLVFFGYGTAAQGATLTQINATQWSINSADGLIHDIITLANGQTVHASDYFFGP